MSEGLFEYKDEQAARMHIDFIKLTDGTEPCYDPYLVDENTPRIYESHTDRWVENYSNRGVTAEEAEAMCEPCHVKEECLIFALYNEERYGVWGGTTPRQRGWYKGKRIKNGP